MSADEIERLVQEAERFQAHEDEANKGRVEANNALENYLFQVKKSVNDEKVASVVSVSDKQKVLSAVETTTD